MSNERLPQRFRYREESGDQWEYGCCIPLALACGGWGINGLELHFDDNPWQVMGQWLCSPVECFQWIDNDYGWEGDVMPREEIVQ